MHLKLSIEHRNGAQLLVRNPLLPEQRVLVAFPLLLLFEILELS
jgi:hypothetical protein